MIARAVSTKQIVLEVLDLPLFPNAEMQGNNSLGILNWGNLVIRKAEDQLDGVTPLQEDRRVCLVFSK